MSQGSVVTHLSAMANTTRVFAANLRQSQTVKGLWKSVNICQRYA